MRIPQKSIERNSERAMNRCLFMWTKMINYWDNPMSEWKFPKIVWANVTTGKEQRLFYVDKMINYEFPQKCTERNSQHVMNRGLSLWKMINYWDWPKEFRKLPKIVLFFFFIFLVVLSTKWKSIDYLANVTIGKEQRPSYEDKKINYEFPQRSYRDTQKCNERISHRVRNLVIYLWTIW